MSLTMKLITLQDVELKQHLEVSVCQKQIVCTICGVEQSGRVVSLDTRRFGAVIVKMTNMNIEKEIPLHFEMYGFRNSGLWCWHQKD